MGTFLKSAGKPQIPLWTLGLLVLTFAAGRAVGEQWTAPTAEELSMTSVPEAPGAPAIYLFREEITVDHSHTYTEYVRMKILTEGGRDRANVELTYESGGEMSYGVDEVAGRTVHPDGTIVAFAGKPYERSVVKRHGLRVKALVFTLPDVTVGSIIEYRYRLHWDFGMYAPPRWIVQNDFYLKSGHFLWKPTNRTLNMGPKDEANRVEWTPILPPGVEVTKTPSALRRTPQNEENDWIIDLKIKDVAPAVEEEYMPPLASQSYRVLFYYTFYKSAEEFWQGEGQRWSKDSDKFDSPGHVVTDAVKQLVMPGDSDEQKLRKIYAAVQGIDNSDYTREHTRVEDKASGLSKVKTADDIWSHKRGSSDEINSVFIAMARAAGFKAYAMRVSNRDTHLFMTAYLSLNQLDDDVAVVSVGGKDIFFDPGTRYCPYGHMAWKHTDTAGLRQTDGGAAIAKTPGEPYTASEMDRVANLKMDEHGAVTGVVDLSFTGSPALEWRHKLLTGDRQTVESGLTEEIERSLPAGMDVKLLSIDHIDAYEEPLTAKLRVSGTIGSSTGTRLLIPGDLFLANATLPFAHEQRVLPIAMPYRHCARDAVHIALPEGFTVESLPAQGSLKLPKMAVYNSKTTANASGLTTRRDLYIAEIFFLQKEYPELRGFYSQLQAKDQEPIVLKLAKAAPPI